MQRSDSFERCLHVEFVKSCFELKNWWLVVNQVTSGGGGGPCNLGHPQCPRSGKQNNNPGQQPFHPFKQSKQGESELPSTIDTKVHLTNAIMKEIKLLDGVFFRRCTKFLMLDFASAPNFIPVESDYPADLGVLLVSLPV